MFTGLSLITMICLRAFPGLRGYVYGLVLDYKDMFTGLSRITRICLRACPGLRGYV